MNEHVCAVSRRRLIRLAAAGTALVSASLPAARVLAGEQETGERNTSERGSSERDGGEENGGKEKEVGAVEDLMREHGVLRRALIVYRESARLLRQGDTVPTGPLADTAELFREFGEDYHERLLEEQHIFPVLRKRGGQAGALVDVLIAQHRRGREITDFISATVAGGAIAAARTQPLAKLLEDFARMYEAHAAREDTVVFPAWKAALSTHELGELGERFEEIEHRQFGEDGFDDAVRRIGRVEQTLGIHDLAGFTAPLPPDAAPSL